MTAQTSLPPLPRAPWLVAIATVVVGYFVALHVLIVDGAWPVVALAMIVAPWWIAAVSTALRRPRSPWRTLLVVSAVVLPPWIALLGAEALTSRVDRVLLIENVTFLVALATLFASTLGRRGEPLITRLARVARRGDMPPAVLRYTRAATIAWAAFFAVAAVLSVVLFVTQSRALWSSYVNLALWPLVAAMFGAEYAVRVRVLRGIVHGSLMTGVQAFRQR